MGMKVGARMMTGNFVSGQKEEENHEARERVRTTDANQRVRFFVFVGNFSRICGWFVFSNNTRLKRYSLR